MSRWVLATRRRAIVATALALLLAVLVAVPAGADADKTFTADAKATVPAGGTDTSYWVSITNEAAPQTLGSANITVPDGLEPGGLITVTGDAAAGATAILVGRELQVRNLSLPPAGTAVINLTVSADCGQLAPYVWDQMAVKQANDFNGTGNDFAMIGPAPSTDVSGTCSLDFIHDPASAEVDAAISATDFVQPGDGGQPIVVEVIAADGTRPLTTWTAPISLALAPITWTANIAGAAAVPVGGIATFDGAAAPSIDTSAAGYRLIATSSDGVVSITSGESASFAIVDLAEPCVPAEPCTGGSNKPAEGQTNGTEAFVVADGSDGTLVVTVASASANPDVAILEGVCTTLVRHSHLVEFTIDQPTIDVLKTVEITLFDATLRPAEYDVCWAGGDATPVIGEDPWTQKDGTPAVARQFLDFDGQPLWLYVGVAPTCKKNGRNAASEPCVSSRTKDQRAGTVTIVVSAPSGDPKGFV